MFVVSKRSLCVCGYKGLWSPRYEIAALTLSRMPNKYNFLLVCLSIVRSQAGIIKTFSRGNLVEGFIYGLRVVWEIWRARLSELLLWLLTSSMWIVLTRLNVFVRLKNPITSQRHYCHWRVWTADWTGLAVFAANPAGWLFEREIRLRLMLACQ